MQRLRRERRQARDGAGRPGGIPAGPESPLREDVCKTGLGEPFFRRRRRSTVDDVCQKQDLAGPSSSRWWTTCWRGSCLQNRRAVTRAVLVRVMPDADRGVSLEALDLSTRG